MVDRKTEIGERQGLILIGLIGVIMFIYHGCDNLKHLFSNFIGRSGIQPVIELVFETVQKLFPALLISYGISFHILITLALQKFLRIPVCTTGNFRFKGSLDILVCLSFSPGTRERHADRDVERLPEVYRNQCKNVYCVAYKSL